MHWIDRKVHPTVVGVIVSLLLLARAGALVPRTRLRLLQSRAIFSTMDDFDDSFLADFDVDAAVRARQTPSQPTPATKKLKVTPSPAVTTSTALYASKSPFAENSPFSSGNVSNPTQELAKSVMPNPPQQLHSPAPNQSALESTLQSYFGYSKFRKGQLEVLQAVLQKRDAAVFWATGSGKSLCYQIPALHTGNTAIVVSPLISLMQDQCNKLNGLSQEPLATFLGSGQLDASQEAAALAGKYRLVYVTPEKLLSGGFLEQLARMHTLRPLSLIAIDESHCVSEWGHDFRPEYRNLHKLRSHPVLAEVPLVCLTATAIPRVQTDIVQSLQLRNPLLARQSFDRTNLEISVHKKKGPRAALDPLLPKMAQQSTIIYAPTRDQVQEIADYLSTKLPGVEAYHAGLPQEQRTRAHTNFLVGQTKVIVATVAFGMGIDKPDTRRVIHYGPPKTVEEYYQQIGRAGRDGLNAECIMFVSDGDFDRYKSDFYVGGLTGSAKEATLNSIDSLRKYALDMEKCRRKALLDFFQETSAFGERCGTCDTCRRIATYGADSERDLGAKGARMVLKAMDALDEQGLSVIDKVIAGNIVESYRYKRGCNSTAVQQYIQNGRREMGIRVPASYFRELVAPLVTKGYVEQGSKNMIVNGYSVSLLLLLQYTCLHHDTSFAQAISFPFPQRSWTTYALTPLGRNAMNDTNVPIVLPVPASIREMELKEEEKRKRVLKQLDDAGVKIDQLPKEEIESGDGEVIRAFSKWHGYLESMRRNNRDERITQLEDLLSRIETWRADAASKYLMAPSAVLAEHTMVFIAYTIATMKPGLKVEPSALIAAGVRTRELDSLVTALNQWVEEVQPGQPGSGDATISGDDAAMVFPEGPPFAPEKPWEYAAYKPNKKTGVAVWESSHERFLNGEHPQSIAMSPANGKPIQMNTVVGHILDGLVLGRPVPLNRLAQFLPPPTKSEWQELKEAEATTGMSVVGDPNTSGLGGSKFTLTEFLRPIMGDSFVDTPFTERTVEDKAKFGHWCDMMKWYMALRRVGYEPTFSE